MVSGTEDLSTSLGTGLESLDSELENGGFSPGMVLTVVGSPLSVSQHLVYNLIAGRPTQYVSALRATDNIEETVRILYPEVNLNVSELPYSGDGSAAADHLSEHLLELDQEDLSPAGGDGSPDHPPSVVVDPVNAAERADVASYHDFLQQFRDVVSEYGGLGILHAVDETDREPPEQRWQTLQASDVVMRIDVSMDDQEVQNKLFIPKIHGDLQLEQRSFELPNGLDLDAGTKESITA